MSGQIFNLGIIFLLSLQFFYVKSDAQQKKINVDGLRRPSPYIINGKKAKIGQFPAMVSLRNTSGFHFCGGTIVADYWILTAAHCTLVYERYIAMAGEIDQVRRGWHTHRISEQHVHPMFIFDFYIDLAMIKVRREFSINEKTIDSYRIIDYEVKPGQKCQLAGWGRTWHGPRAKGSYSLLYIDVIITKTTRNPYLIFFNDSKSNTMACYGDSGSGLICDGKVAGVTTFVEHANCTGFTAFASTYHYFWWIAEHVMSPGGEGPSSNTFLKTSLNAGSTKKPQFLLLFTRVIVFFYIYTYFFHQ